MELNTNILSDSKWPLQLIEIQKEFNEKVNTLQNRKDVITYSTPFIKEHLALNRCAILKPKRNKHQFDDIKDIIEQGIESMSKDAIFYLLQQNTNLDSKFTSKFVKSSVLLVKLKQRYEKEQFLVCYSTTKNFFDSEKVCLCVSIVENAMLRLHALEEAEILHSENKSLEHLLTHKKKEVENALETISSQFNEVQRLAEKGRVLLKEVHHRVNNNLQIINSIIKMYLSNASEEKEDTLLEIMGRIHTMSLIHMNIMKSVELDRVHLNGYLDDLTFHIRSQFTGIPLIFQWKTKIESFPLDTLIPLGLLINEMTYFLMKREFEGNDRHIDIHIKKVKKEYELNIKSNTRLPFDLQKLSDEGEINPVLILALIEQLEGSFETEFKDGIVTKIRFSEI